MPTPVAHTLAGYVVSRFVPEQRPSPAIWMILLCLLMANVPDLDFIPGLIAGRPGLFHSGITHSLGFALLLSLVTAGLLKFWQKPFWLVFNLSFVSYLTHLLLDYLNPDGSSPYGIPFFWPLSGEYFISPVSIFTGVRHAGSTAGSTFDFIKSVVNFHNLSAIFVEALILAPFVLLGQLYRIWRANRNVKVSLEEILPPGD